jgi:hypothetical protein
MRCKRRALALGAEPTADVQSWLLLAARRERARHDGDQCNRVPHEKGTAAAPSSLVGAFPAGAPDQSAGIRFTRNNSRQPAGGGDQSIKSAVAGRAQIDMLHLLLPVQTYNPARQHDGAAAVSATFEP